MLVLPELLPAIFLNQLSWRFSYLDLAVHVSYVSGGGIIIMSVAERISTELATNPERLLDFGAKPLICSRIIILSFYP